MDKELARGLLEQRIGCIVGLQRFLIATSQWLESENRSAAVGGILELAEHIAEECQGVPNDEVQYVADRWLEAEHRFPGKPWPFARFVTNMLPHGLSHADIRYFAMLTVRRRYSVPLSAVTARLFHDLSYRLRTLSESAAGQDIPFEKVLHKIVGSETALTSDHKLFLAACVILDLFEPLQGDRVSVRPECSDAEYLLSYLFGVPSGIPGFDALFGGGGLMLSDHGSTNDSPSGTSSEFPTVIGGRAVLCTGPFGSGKSLLSLQFAVEVARKGGIAWVMALEQTPAECLYALESIGVSTSDPAFQVVQGLTDAFLALCQPTPTRGALVFLRPEDGNKDYGNFLASIQQRLKWMASYPLRLLVIDPVNALTQDKDSKFGPRSSTHKMLEAAKREHVNVWFTREQVSSENTDPGRFAENIADTVIHLNWETNFGQQQRYIEIKKSRFQREHSGHHGMVIESHGGIHIYPSSAVIARMIRGVPALKREAAVYLGVPGMERVLGPEPIHPGDLVVLAGPGKAKTLTGLQYLLAEQSGETRDFQRLFVSDYTRARMDRALSTIRDPILQRRAEEVDRCPLPSGYIDPGRILQEIQNELERCRKTAPVVRLLITNLARWEESMPFITSDAGFGMALITLVRSYNAAAVVICGDSLQRGSRLRDTMFDQSDFLLHFNQAEFQGRRTTLVHAVKTRLMRHQRESFALLLEPDGIKAQPAPLFRIDRVGTPHPIPISLFLHAETDNHKQHNQRMVEALAATISPNAKIEDQSRRLDMGMLQLAQFSAVDELQIFQMDEFQLPTVPAAQAHPDILSSFDLDLNGHILRGRMPTLRSRVLSKDKKRFLAVPFYVNISFFAVNRSWMTAFCERHKRFSGPPKSWFELAEMCTQWEKDDQGEGDLFFSCPVYEHSAETYNCLFLEIVYSLRKPTKKEFENIALWFQDETATEAGYLFRRLCRSSHAKGYGKGQRPKAVIARHWYNTLNQELSGLGPEDRAQFVGMPLFDDSTTAGEWYLTVPANSAAPDVGLRLIEQLTMPDRETQRVDLGVGLPTRSAYYESAEFSEASVSRYFHFSRALVDRLLRKSIRRSDFRGYQRFSNTISTHLQWLLDIPDGPEAKVREEIARLMNTLASDIEFLQNSAGRIH